MGQGLVAHNFARALFGAGEAGNFPASIKTVAEWFPKKERALATGIFNSGSNVGAMICALIIPMILYAWYPTSEGGHLFLGIFHGWQMAFIITGVIGRITSYNVCYTKLLRVDKRSEKRNSYRKCLFRCIFIAYKDRQGCCTQMCKGNHINQQP